MPTIKKLKFTEKGSYSPDGAYYALAKIDRAAGTCESRKSEDESLAAKYGFHRYCAEEFGVLFSDPEVDKSIILHHNSNQSQNIANFISECEKLLELKENGLGSLVFETDNPKVTAIRVSKFWRECPLRRRVFILLARLGKIFRDFGHEKENVFDCMARDQLLKECIPALQLFFAGFVHFSPKCHDQLSVKLTYGFCFQFRNKPAENIKNVLLFESKNDVPDPDYEDDYEDEDGN